jgi:hypothetical protein
VFRVKKLYLKGYIENIFKMATFEFDFCSNFYKNAYFGGYPSKTEFNKLINTLHITDFIDLTTVKERRRLDYNYEFDLTEYNNISYTNYSILDNKIPKSTDSFLGFLYNTVKKIESDKYIYIHCKGGHGRSTLLVACLLMYFFAYTSETSLQCTKKFHGERKNLKDKYKDIQVPQSNLQRKYIHYMFEK